MNANGYQFFVAAKGDVRLPVRENQEAVRRDAKALGKGAEIVPLLHREARRFLEADRRAMYAPAG